MRAACLGAWLLVLGPLALSAGPAEQAVLNLWRRQAEMSPGEAAELCDRALASGALSVYAPVAVTLRGWRLLQTGHNQAAAATFSKALSDRNDPLARAADTQARRWLSRLDREVLVTALRRWYALHVAYPPALDALQTLENVGALPMSDRWGDPWRYQLMPMRRLQGLSDQRYQLESRAMFGMTDLRKALQAGNSDRSQVRIVRLVSRQPPALAVEITPPGLDKINATLALGAISSGIRLCAIAPELAIFSDGDRWIVHSLSSQEGTRQP